MPSEPRAALQRWESKRWVARAGSVALVAAALVGCVAGTASPAAHGPRALTPPATGYAEVWLNTDFQPTGQPIAMGSVIVGLATQGGRLYLVGLDPVTGRELWKQLATVPSSVTQAEPAHLVVLGDKVAYFRPDRMKNDFNHLVYNQLVVADPRTGDEVTSSPLAQFTSWPYPCVNGVDLCVISHGNLAGVEHQYRLWMAKNDYVVDSESLPPSTRVLAEPQLLDLANRPENTLGWLRDHKIQWRVPIDAAFPRGFTSDAGWSWHIYAEQRVVVGTVYSAIPAGNGAIVRDLASSAASAGLSETTGDVLWRDTGSVFGCLEHERHLPVRCRQRGTARFDARVRIEGLDVTVEGFEPATGKTTWSVALGAEDLTVDPAASRTIAGDTKIVVHRSGEPLVLDYANGTLTRAGGETTYWCLTSTRYYMAPPYLSSSGARYDRPGGKLAAICDVHGQPATALPAVESTLAVGAHVDDHAVIATRNAYLGIRLR